MNFFKIFLISFFLTFSIAAFADNHDTTQSEDVNQISQEIQDDEEVPLNDPFVGDASLGGASTVSVITNSDEERAEMSLYNFKLVGIMNGEYESYVSLINATGEVVTLQINEELSPGIKLIALKNQRAIFEKGDNSFLVINFKNQIKETSEPF